MIKGSRKQMIVVRTGGSRYFDEAYFVFRREVKPEKQDRRDLLAEVNRILDESAGKREAGIRASLFAVLLFLFGGALGAGIALLCLLL